MKSFKNIYRVPTSTEATSSKTNSLPSLEGRLFYANANTKAKPTLEGVAEAHEHFVVVANRRQTILNKALVSS